MVDLTSVQALPETGDWPETIPRQENGWRQTGGAVNPALDQGLANWQARELATRTRILKGRLDLLGVRAASLVTVGTGGDFATINAALVALSERRPAYVAGGFTTELRLLAGFVMREQVLVKSINLGWITITSVDAEVQIDRAYLVTVSEGGMYPAFSASDGGVLPTIGVLFSMMVTGAAANRVGIHLYATGAATVLAGKGVRGAGYAGARLNTAARLAANGAVFSGSGAVNVQIHGGSSASLASADLRSSGGIGLDVTNCSQVNAVQAQFASCVQGIVASRGSTVNAVEATARCGSADAVTDIAVASGATISAIGATGGVSQTVNTLTASGMIFR